MSGYSGFLFDFDFTLVTALPGITASYNAAFRAFGLPERDSETVKKTVGLPVPVSFRMMNGQIDEETSLKLTALFDKAADEYMTPNTVFLPGAREILLDVCASGGRSGVVTTKKGYRIRDFFSVQGMTHTLSLVIGGSDVKKMKPDPEGLLAAASAFASSFGMKKSDILYIGDNPVDALAASAAGIDFAAVATGSSSKEELAVHPHVFLCGDMTELRGILFPKKTDF